MVFRTNIKSSIIERADEDLRRLLFVEDPHPEEFNYSPLILRSVNDYLLKNNKSIALGDITSKDIIDSYWKGLSLPYSEDVRFRLVVGNNNFPYLQLFIFFREQGIKDKVKSPLYEIKELKIKNPLTYVFITDLYDNRIYDVIEECMVIFEENELNFSTEEFKLKEITIKEQGYSIKFQLPELFCFQCQRCNVCELPSNYSVNPIANQPESSNEEKTITFNHRVCFPCNLPTLELFEAERISEHLSKEIRAFTQPLLYLKNDQLGQEAFIVGLKQKTGICIFQDLTTNSCMIQGIKPFTCFMYPLLVNYDEKEVTVECDFACPGVGKGEKVSKKEIAKLIVNHSNCKEEKTFMSYLKTPTEIEKYWKGNVRAFFDKKRVTKEDIMIAKKAIFSG